MRPTIGIIQINRGDEPYNTINHGNLSGKITPSIALLAMASIAACVPFAPVPIGGGIAYKPACLNVCCRLRHHFFLFWMVLGSAFPEPKTARKNVSANGNGEGGGEVGVGKWRWMEVSD